MTRLLQLLALAVLLAVPAPAMAQTFPELTDRVVDQADLLRPEQELDLKSKLESLEAQSGRQFVVVTVNSLEDQAIEDYGYQLGRAWGIGSEENDDGVILLVAPNERKVRIETGYGAEGFLTDIVSGRIIRDTILPRFREGDMPGGIMAGADEIIGWMELPEGEAIARAEQIGEEERQNSDGAGQFVPFVIMAMIFGFMALSAIRRASGRRYRGKGRHKRRRDGGIDPLVILWGLDAISKASRGGRGGWGGGGGFGGFGGGGGGFSGGGGSFGGGGASGGW